MKMVQLDEVKTAQLNESVNNVLNEVTAQMSENVCALYGHNVKINDTEWQVVYDLKVKIIEAVEQLGLVIEDEL